MSSFDDRKNAFEAQYAHDQELQFKVEVRACKLFGLWLGSKLGLTGADAETYAKEIISANMDEPGFEDVKRKALADIQKANLDISGHMLDVHLENFLKEARTQIMAS